MILHRHPYRLKISHWSQSCRYGWRELENNKNLSGRNGETLQKQRLVSSPSSTKVKMLIWNVWFGNDKQKFWNGKWWKIRGLKRCGWSSAISPQTKPLKLPISSLKTAKIMSAQSRRQMHSSNCRANDKVWRDKLFFKMQQMGVPAKIIRWVQAWLYNRLTWVTFDGEISQTVILKQGVPQGSVLSPLLFLFYINDLPNGIAQSIVSFFVDDVAAWSQTSGLQQAEHSLQTTLNHIAEWSKRLKMELSFQNVRMLFSHHQHAPSKLAFQLEVKWPRTHVKSHPQVF